MALEGGLHPDVRRDVDVVRGREPALDVGGDVAFAAHAAVLGDRGEQLGRREAALGGDALERGLTSVSSAPSRTLRRYASA